MLKIYPVIILFMNNIVDFSLAIRSQNVFTMSMFNEKVLHNLEQPLVPNVL